MLHRQIVHCGRSNALPSILLTLASKYTFRCHLKTHFLAGILIKSDTNIISRYCFMYYIVVLLYSATEPCYVIGWLSEWVVVVCVCVTFSRSARQRQSDSGCMCSTSCYWSLQSSTTAAPPRQPLTYTWRPVTPAHLRPTHHCLCCGKAHQQRQVHQRKCQGWLYVSLSLLLCFWFACWVKRCTTWEDKGIRQRGRPKRTWWDCVKNDMESLGLSENDAQSRNKWRRRIKGATG